MRAHPSPLFQPVAILGREILNERVARCLFRSIPHCYGTLDLERCRHASSPATQVRMFHLNAPLAQVFPLFTAQGERAWAPGWELSVLAATTRYMRLTGTFARGTKNAEFQPHRALGPLLRKSVRCVMRPSRRLLPDRTAF